MIFETARLGIREFTFDDAEFTVELVNSEGWRKFIGTNGPKTAESAKTYLEKVIISSYKKFSYGLWLVELKDSRKPIGMCGLVNRGYLEDVDIGFAILPEYEGLGFGFESANATMLYAKNILKLEKIIGITSPQNVISIKLLSKLGLQFEKSIKDSQERDTLVFSPPNKSEGEKQIDELIARFFDLFTNTDGRIPNLKEIFDLCIPEGMLISNTNGKPVVYNLQEFIAPREKMLTDGTLTDFSEFEITGKTKIFGNIAQRFSFYEKSGKMNNEPFTSRGMKTIQFVKIGQEWKISSVAWSDES